MHRPLFLAAVLATCVVTGQSIAFAQDIDAKHPLQPSDTSSPRATLRSFVDACNELYDWPKQNKLLKTSAPRSFQRLSVSTTVST